MPNPTDPASIFGSYDIRGRFPQDFPAATCRRIADALAAVEAGTFVVARDVRTASARLERAVVGRLNRRAGPTLDLGIQPTPLLGFASSYLGLAGLAFTPSHNALGYAGVKAFRSNGRMFDREWDRVRTAFSREAPPRPTPSKRTGVRSRSTGVQSTPAAVLEAYLDHVTRGLTSTRTVVVDGRGGPTTRLAPQALARLGVDVRSLHPGFSARYHGLSPEPRRDDVAELGRRVREDGADFGIAFDGDGDRVVFVDEKGRWVEPEAIAWFLYRHLAPAERPWIVSADASERCEARAAVVRVRVGSRFVSAAMRRHRATVGFEASSHFYLARWGPNSDGILTAGVVSHFLDDEGISLGAVSRAFGPIDREQRVLAQSSRAEARRVFRRLRSSLSAVAERTIDGYRIRLPAGSVLFRLSNTQPAIRITMEARPGAPLSGLRRQWDRLSQSRSDEVRSPGATSP